MKDFFTEVCPPFLYAALLIGIAVVGVMRADLSPSAGLGGSSSATVINTISTTAVKPTGGILRRIVVTTPVNNATVKLFDLAGPSCTGSPSLNPRAVITMPAPALFFLEFQQPFVNGICVQSSSVANFTVVFD